MARRGGPRRPPRATRSTAAAALLLALSVQAGAPAGATPFAPSAPFAARPAVRQSGGDGGGSGGGGGGGSNSSARSTSSSLRGAACDSDNACGGYAVSPPLWCVTGPGADAPTCRAYVDEGDACGGSGVACAATTRWGSTPLSCVDGVCSTFVTAVGRGDVCPSAQRSPPPCGVGHVCRGVEGGGFAFRCVSVARAGVACGGRFALCADGVTCVADGGGGAACPLTDTPPGADAFARSERYRFPVCGNATAGGGTCRPEAAPTVGTPCDRLGVRDEVCGRGGNATLICSFVDRAGSSGVTQCVARTAPGSPCTLSGTSVCSEQPPGEPPQLCIGGVCVVNPFGVPISARRGDECSFQDECVGDDGDGLECRFWGGLANPVCFATTVPAGGACGADGFGVCDADAGLTCTDGVCVAAEPVRLGEVCDNRLGRGAEDGGPCAAVPALTANRSGSITCAGRVRPGDANDRRCVFLCDDGDACGGEWELCRRVGARILDGVCVHGRVAGDACNRAWECGSDRGLTCRPTDGDGGGAGSGLWDRPGVCATTGAAGAACNASTESQCAAGLSCTGGVCGDRPVGVGGACTGDADCKPTAGGEQPTCWRGRGATGPTCRAWVGPYADCSTAASKCWRPSLVCEGEGDAAVCVNAEGGGELGAYCRLDGDDCRGVDVGGGGDGGGALFCADSVFTGAPVCKVLVAEGERCDPGQGSDLRLCDGDAGFVCRYKSRGEGYVCVPA